MWLVFENYKNLTSNCEIITPSFGQNYQKFSPAQLLMLEIQEYAYGLIWVWRIQRIHQKIY